MDQIRPTEGRASEGIVRDEERVEHAPNYRTQPKTTAKKPIVSLATKIFAVTLIIAVIIGVATMVFFFRAGVSIFSVYGNSMEPFLKNGETVILKQEREVAKDQVIFFRKPSNWPDGNDDRTLVKRVVATPGDTFLYENREFKINDQVISKLPEDYECNGPDGFSTRLNSRQILVMGDNVNHSIDSRRVFCNGNLDRMFVSKNNVVDYGHIVGRF